MLTFMEVCRASRDWPVKKSSSPSSTRMYAKSEAVCSVCEGSGVLLDDICPSCDGIGHCEDGGEEDNDEEPASRPWLELIETNSVEMTAEEKLK